MSKFEKKKYQNIRKVIKPKNKRPIRGKRKCIKRYKKSLRLLGVNAAGLKSKFTSFKKVILDLKPSVFFIQETKFQEEGQLKLDEYIIYEKLRKKEKAGGGLALGCHKDLNPCWVSEGNENVEVLSIDIFLKNIRIRCCAAYGPQEGDSLEKKEAFWNQLDKEVSEAEKNGSGFILQFDGNLWAGAKIVPGDPRPQNKNGYFLEQFLNRNPRLTIVNSLPECQGLITRSRFKNGILEESVLDFFIVCSSVLPFVTRMVIDDAKNHILTNYKAAKRTGKAVDSDHYTVYLDLELEISKDKPERQEIFNFKDKDSQQIFKKNTTDTSEFTDCFDGDNSLIDKIEKWRQVLKKHCSKAFKKIRIQNKKTKPFNKKIIGLINKRNRLTRAGCTCDTKSMNESNLQVHNWTHEENPKFMCGKCSKRFGGKGDLVLHEKRHKDLKSVCAECGKQVNGKEKLEVHVKIHNGKQKLISLSTKKRLEKHESIHTEKKLFKCIHCEKTFQQNGRLNNHLRVHRGALRNRCKNCNDEIDSINSEIAKEEAAENRGKILRQFEYFSKNPENIEMQKMWKTLKNICPKIKPILPAAKKNHRGKIISSKNDIKKLLEKEFKNRLRSRPYRNDLISTKLRRSKLFEQKLKFAQNNKSQPWTMEELEIALRDLKRNKSRDCEGLVNEIFKSDVIGNNLKKSLLMMFNNIKEESLIPKFMNYSNITTVPKKGPRIELKNQRGIFRVSVIRSILMRMIYNSKYDEIDKNISDGQMGARKGKGCKTNIWIINGIIHETLRSKKKNPIVLQIYDFAQMFDSINLQEALNDIFDYGMNDDNLLLIHKANEEVHMAVKTPGGLTDRQIIRNSVLQGDTFGSLLASVQVDTIAKEVEKAGIGYQYKNELAVNILGLVDDLIGISETGVKAQIMNAILNIKAAEKGLQFGTSKCKMMVIGKNKEKVKNDKIFVDGWTEEYSENETSGEIELLEKYIGKVSIEEVKEQKYLGFILSSEGNNLANIKAMEQKAIGIIRTILSKLDHLKLRQYYFECSKLLMNTILRGSILYAAECYYNLTENHLRRIERIEENFIRKIFKTAKSCPISQLYLEFGQWPARFEIQKMRCFFLKQLLQEDENSQVYRFFKLQENHPIKGDWVSTCLRDLTELRISESIEEIKNMPRKIFKNLIKSRILENALEYLNRKRGSKGQDIKYKTLEMSEYLMPFNSTLNIEDKRKMFEIRNEMIKIPSNFGNKDEKCICGTVETMAHIYSCHILNQNKPEISYNQIHNGNLKSQVETFQRFKHNLEIRRKIKCRNNHPCDPCDPLNCDQYRFG